MLKSFSYCKDNLNKFQSKGKYLEGPMQRVMVGWAGISCTSTVQIVLFWLKLVQPSLVEIKAMIARMTKTVQSTMKKIFPVELIINHMLGKNQIQSLEFLLYMKSCRINLFIGLSLDIPPRVNWVKYYKILMKIAMAPSCGNLLSNFTSRVTQKSLKCPKNLFRLFLHA